MTMKIGLGILIAGLVLMSPVFFLMIRDAFKALMKEFKSDFPGTAFIIGVTLLITGLFVCAFVLGLCKQKQSEPDALPIKETTTTNNQP